MHFTRRLGAAAASALLSALPPTFAQAPAPASGVAVSVEAVDDEAAIVASSRWRDLVARLGSDALRGPADEPGLRSACRDALAKPHATGVSAADACLAAALASFDARAVYFSPAAAVTFKRETTQRPVAVGLEVGRNAPHDPLLVVSPIAGGPGERAGIRPGDLIVRIDGHDTAPLAMEQAVGLLRGPIGSTVRLDIERGPSHDKLSIDAQRAPVHVKTVRREALTAQVAALRLSQFNDYTREDLAKQLDEILGAAPAPPDALLVDLRANPGGLLDTVVQVAGAFSTDDTVVAQLVSRQGSLRPLTAATSKPPNLGLSTPARDWLRRVRVAVLVDAGTASGAEALALFLREQRGARIFGARTFGLASVGQIYPIGGVAMVRIQTNELRSSLGAPWEGVGIVPDTLTPVAAPGARKPEFGSAGDAAFAMALRFLQAP